MASGFCPLPFAGVSGVQVFEHLLHLAISFDHDVLVVLSLHNTRAALQRLLGILPTANGHSPPLAVLGTCRSYFIGRLLDQLVVLSRAE